MKKFKFLLSLIIISTISGCNKKEVNYNLVVVSNSFLSENEEDPLPSIIREALSPYECEGNSLVFVPEVSIYRTDLNEGNEYIIEVPTTPENKLRKKLGSYSYVDLKTDYEENLPKMKAGEFLSKKSSIEKKSVYKYNKQNSLVFSIDENLKDFSELKKKLDSILCLQDENFSKRVIVFLNNSTEITEGPTPPSEIDTTNTTPPIINGPDPCAQTTVTDALDLKEDILNIIDTGRTYKERDQQARETWETYFDPMASVTMYLNPTEKYPDRWESGDGANYFIDRLAYMNSIIDVNITRVEYHRETKKITGLVVIECHNASEVQ